MSKKTVEFYKNLKKHPDRKMREMCDGIPKCDAELKGLMKSIKAVEKVITPGHCAGGFEMYKLIFTRAALEDLAIKFDGFIEGYFGNPVER